jgi:putative ABC transport system permease protein
MIVRAILVRGLVPAVGGAIIGVVGGAMLARVFQSLLFEITPLHALSLLTSVGLVLIVSVTAMLGPALRAANLDPITALRCE